MKRASSGKRSSHTLSFKEALHSQLDDVGSKLCVIHQHEVDFLKAEVAHLRSELGRTSVGCKSELLSVDPPPSGFQSQAKKERAKKEDTTASMIVLEERSCLGSSQIALEEHSHIVHPGRGEQCLMLEAIGVRAFPEDDCNERPQFLSEDAATDLDEAGCKLIESASLSEASASAFVGHTASQSTNKSKVPHFDTGTFTASSKATRDTQKVSHDSKPAFARDRTLMTEGLIIHAFELRDAWSGLYEVAKHPISSLFGKAEDDDEHNVGSSSVHHLMSVGKAKGTVQEGINRRGTGPFKQAYSCRMRDCMISPDSKMRMMWCLASIIVLLYDIITVPIDVSFGLGPENWNTPFGITQFVCRCFWTIDVVVTFFMGVSIDDYVIMDPCEVARTYFHSWFCFDISLVAFEWVAYFLINEDHANSASVLRGARTLRIIRMVRLLRLARVAKLKLALSEVIVLSSDGLTHVAHFVTVTAALAVSIHLSACFWHWLGDSLQNGWVQRCGLTSASIPTRYAVSWHEVLLHSHSDNCLGPVDTLENVIDFLMLFACLIISAWYIGIACLTVTAYAHSDESQIQQIAEKFIKRYKISKRVRRRLRKFQSAQHMEGLGERLVAEARLFSVLPASLQEDLTSEARCPTLRTYQCLADLNVISPRVERHLCNRAVSNLLAIEGEVVFAEGDACSQMLFVMDGELRYLMEGVHSTTDNSLTDQNTVDRSMTLGNMGRGMNKIRRMNFAKRKPSSHSMDKSCSLKGAAMLRAGKYLCEAVLWTHWEHCGELVAQRDSLMLSMRANDFIDVIMQHRTAVIYAAKYARHFVWHLNRLEPSDVLDLKIDWIDLEEDLFLGNEEDHFMFISHFKAEAGTEATLMRDALNQLIKDDRRHCASDLASPVFIDSEDLSDLSKLMTHVERSRVLLVLLTPGIMSRPWCLLEMVTAMRHEVQLLPIEIQRPGMTYAYPDEGWYQRLLTGQIVSQDGIQLLEKEGVTIQDVEKAIRQVFLKIALPFSPHKSGNIRQAELQDILQRSGDGASATQSKAVGRVSLSGLDLGSIDLERIGRPSRGAHSINLLHLDQ